MSDKKDFHDKCTERLSFAISRSAKAQTLIDAIEGLGCKIPDDFLSCRPCDANISGGFVVDSNSNRAGSSSNVYKPQIIMCENKKVEKETFENTLVHELVHAYDQCKVKMDWKNCLHHACTEIRASSLSGECDLLHELYRGHKTIQAGHQECVKRRAQKSLEANPHCKAIAADAVKASFLSCYNDKAPLEE
jgi:inner membrane protease ATP23